MMRFIGWSPRRSLGHIVFVLIFTLLRPFVSLSQIRPLFPCSSIKKNNRLPIPFSGKQPLKPISRVEWLTGLKQRSFAVLAQLVASPHRDDLRRRIAQVHFWLSVAYLEPTTRKFARTPPTHFSFSVRCFFQNNPCCTKHLPKALTILISALFCSVHVDILVLERDYDKKKLFDFGHALKTNS